MTTATFSQGNTRDLPHALRTAQAAMKLAEVSEILRKLSAHGLGIFMPHMHDERTGEFQPLPDGVVQVESGSEVTFQPVKEIATQTARFLPVAWVWREGVSTTVSVCEMVQDEDASDEAEHLVKHKMATRN